MISFVVIGKNEGWRLTKCLTSIHVVINEDKITDYEIIFVDSKSTDDSIDRAQAFDGVKIFEITGECNAAIARNIGALEAKGDILFFIDGDMEILSGFLPKVIVDGELTYPFISGIYEDWIYNENWEFVETKRRYKFSEGMPDNYEVTTGGLFVIEKKLWELVGGMDSRLVRSQDLDLGLRLANMTMLLHRKPIFLAKHHTKLYLNGISKKQYLANVKYSAILSRKHFINKNYWSLFLKTQYSVFILILSLLLSFFITVYCSIFYITIGLLKSYKMFKKSNQSFLDLYLILLYRDIQFLYTFLFVYPVIKNNEYVKIA